MKKDPKLISSLVLLGGLILVTQGNTGHAGDTACGAINGRPPAISHDEYADRSLTFERDVDGDGRADVVRLKETRGSEALSTRGTLTLSASGDIIEISRDISFASMINIHIVPPALVGDDRAPRRNLVEDALFQVVCAEPEPSLSRLLRIDDALVWLDGSPTLPVNYTVYYEEAPVGLIPFVGAWSELGLDSDRPVAVWVEYLGGSHSPADEDWRNNTRLLDNGFEVLAMTPRYRALGTRHGVVGLDIATERYAWLYVFRGGHDLGRKSIEGATLDGGEATITARVGYPGAAQTGTITVDLYSGRFTESWGPSSSDTTSQQRPPE